MRAGDQITVLPLEETAALLAAEGKEAVNV